MFGDDKLYPSLPEFCKVNILQKYDGDKDSKLRKRKRVVEKYLDQQFNKQLTGKTINFSQGKSKVSKKGRKLSDEQFSNANLTPLKGQRQWEQPISVNTTSQKKSQQKKKQNVDQNQLMNNLSNFDEISNEDSKGNHVTNSDENEDDQRNSLQDKKQRKKKQKLDQIKALQQQDNGGKMSSQGIGREQEGTEGKPKSKFFAKLEQQLQGGRFRWLNQQLYTIDSKAALKLMQENKEYFEDYHNGFRTQTAQWPLQPINQAIDFVKRKSANFVVADFGCGEAQLAKSVPNSQVYSIDLVSNNPKVIACDMAHTPLKDEECDVVIFCLALMGLNYGDFLQEANRVLKKRGWLWIAEVRSRFDRDKKLKPFVDGIESMGFQLMDRDLKNTHFVVLVFKKKQDKKENKKKIQWPELKTCLYKKR